MGHPKTLYVQHVTVPFFGRAWEERPAGYAVRYDMYDDEAQAEIARLQDENERANDVLESQAHVISDLLARLDAAHNAAIEAAARLIECDGDAMGGKSGVAAAIRALKRHT